LVKKRLSKSSLLWFVRSRSYVTIADVRRRFAVGLEGNDDVSAMTGPTGSRAYVGLPPLQARLLQDLWQEGRVGLEMAADIKAPSVTGVYGIYQRGEFLPFTAPGMPRDRDHEAERESGQEEDEASSLV
jgi:hypothetical protein